MKTKVLEKTNWTGSRDTYITVRNQIERRWGSKIAKKLDCSRNCRTYNSWKEMGFRVKRGETALSSVTYIPVENKKGGEVTNVIKRKVNLFYYPQLERVYS